MLGMLGFDERAVRKALGVLYKALILGTLLALFAFAPLRQQPLGQGMLRQQASLPTTTQVLWLDSQWGHGDHGEGLRLTFEE